MYLNGSLLPWIAIIMSLAAAFWQVANPRDDIKQAETRLQTQITERETLETHREFSNRILKELETINSRFLSDVVPRKENDGRWMNYDNQIAMLRSTVQEMRKDYSSTYGPGDQLRSLQEQIKEIREIVRDNAKPLNRTTPP